MGYPGRAARRVTAALAICAAPFVAGCSAGNYPQALDTAMPRADSPMTPDQIKQATDDLISDRNQLSAQAPANSQANLPPPPPPQPPPPNVAASTAAQYPAGTQSAAAVPKP